MYVSGGGSYRGKKVQAWREHLKRGRRKRLDEFAEMLAEGYTVTAAARCLGVSQQAGSSMLRQIREELGAQAE